MSIHVLAKTFHKKGIEDRDIVRAQGLMLFVAGPVIHTAAIIARIGSDLFRLLSNIKQSFQAKTSYMRCHEINVLKRNGAMILKKMIQFPYRLLQFEYYALYSMIKPQEHKLAFYRFNEKKLYSKVYFSIGIGE